ncbi:Mobile element protein (plasmid) [Rhodococcus sp. WAY2]|nr:Mobile element protein [Rhodococcus sp. WAY2]
MIDEGGYGRFGAYSRVELERFFHLDDEDRRLVAARRRRNPIEQVLEQTRGQGARQRL